MNKQVKIRVAIPMFIIAVTLVASFLLPYIYPEFNSTSSGYMKDSSGKLIAAPPYNPQVMPPLGSDKIGRNIAILLIAGAKYTILAAIGIAFLRMLFGFFFGLIYTFLSKKVVKHVKAMAEVFQFIPLVIIVYALLFYVDKAFQLNSLGSTNYLIIQMLVISIVIVPSLGIYIGEEMKLFMSNEFIQASKTMGGNKRHLVTAHLWPQFRRHSVVLFSEQISQTLALLIQLGIIYITLGGLKIINFGIGGTDPEYFTVTNEWAAMISINLNQIFVNPWLVVSPLLFFSMLIFLINTISSNLKILLLDSNQIMKNSKLKDIGERERNLYSRQSRFELVNLKKKSG
jgi:ABC-type dipeptide/oligopeptide/nickel transport system permease subunit